MGGFYINRLPWYLRLFYPAGLWRIRTSEKVVYLTFDDGPHPTITSYVLALLAKYEAKATFFCIGNNVLLYPDTFNEIVASGHRIGNHTFDHLNAWHTPTDHYIENIQKAQKLIPTTLFRPPYGRITHRQAKSIRRNFSNMQLVYWDLLSADFDTTLAAGDCVDVVLKKVRPGSIIVFHDSEKAFPRLENALPTILEELIRRGFRMEVLP